MVPIEGACMKPRYPRRPEGGELSAEGDGRQRFPRPLLLASSGPRIHRSARQHLGCQARCSALSSPKSRSIDPLMAWQGGRQSSCRSKPRWKTHSSPFHDAERLREVGAAHPDSVAALDRCFDSDQRLCSWKTARCTLAGCQARREILASAVVLDVHGHPLLGSAGESM